MKTEPLDQILQNPWIWRGRGSTKQAPTLATGHDLLDRELPEGWTVGAVTELLVDGAGCGELSLLLPALRALAQTGRHIVWVAPPWLPYAPALHQQGLDLGRLHLLQANRSEEALWATEQLLRSGACAAVLCWPRKINDRHFRRLQLAAEAGDSWSVVFRSSATRGEHSPAALRIAVKAHQQHTLLEVVKRRGGRPPGPLLLTRSAGNRAVTPGPNPIKC